MYGIACGSLEMQDAKNRRLGTITQLCHAISLQLARIDNRKKNLLSSNISSTFLHNMVNFSLLAAEIVSLVWAPQLISSAFACWLRYCIDFAQRKPTKLFTMFGPYLGW